MMRHDAYLLLSARDLSPFFLLTLTWAHCADEDDPSSVSETTHMSGVMKSMPAK